MRLRIVTYNIHKGRGADQRHGLDRIVDLLGAYEPDVVALQEVFRYDEPREEVACQAHHLAEELGFEHFAVDCNVPRKTGVYGNATLSRLPFAETESIDLTWWVKKRRTALYTRVCAPSGELNLFNVHLGLAHIERMQQMKRLLSHLEDRIGYHDAQLIVGDTNDWYGRLHPKILRDAGFRCAFETAARPAARTFPSWLPVGSLDRVFCRGSMRLVDTYPGRSKLARVASDHLPVIVDLELPAA